VGLQSEPRSGPAELSHHFGPKNCLTKSL